MKREEVWLAEFDDAAAVGDVLEYEGEGVGFELDWDDPQVREVAELVSGEDAVEQTPGIDAAIAELVGYELEPAEDVGFGIPKFVKKAGGVVKSGGKAIYGGAKKIHEGAQKVRDVTGKVIKSPFMKYTQMGVSFAYPAAGQAMKEGLEYADNIIEATYVVDKYSAKAVKAAKDAKQLISRTKKAAASGDKDAQRGLKLLMLAKKKRDLKTQKRFRAFLLKAILLKRAQNAKKKRQREFAARGGIRGRENLRRLKGKSRRRVKKTAKSTARRVAKPATPGYLVDHTGRVLAGKWRQA